MTAGIHRLHRPRLPSACIIALRVLALVLTLSAAASAQLAESYGAFRYFNRGSYIEIIECSRYASGSVTIPSNIYGVPVTKLRASSFSGCEIITSVTIPSSVTTIGSATFSGCSRLSSITIPSSVTQIGTNPFTGCTALSSIGVSSYSSYYRSDGGMLYSKSRTSLYACPPGKTGAVSLPATVTKLRDSAFSGCEKITSVDIPASVSTMGLRVFFNCNVLNAITVDVANASFASVDGLLYSKDLTTLIRCPGGKTGHLALAPETDTVTSGALSYCSYETVALPDGLTELAAFMFYRCANLKSLTIPETVTSIGSSAFGHCYALEEMVIPSSVTSFGNNIFYVCSGLSRVTLPANLRAIGEGWFYQCESLGGITLPDSVTVIGGDAFSHCLSLSEIRIPDGVERIGIRAFFGSGLQTVTVPPNVTSIENIAFSSCLNLKKIQTDPSNSSYRSIDGVLYSKELTTLIQCPAGKIGAVTVPASVTNILMNAFSYCGNINIVRFMGNAPTLGPSAGTDFTIYYFQGRVGFSSPTWMGYSSVEDAQPTDIGNWLVAREFSYDSDLRSDPHHAGVNLLLTYALDLDPRGNPAQGIPYAKHSESEISLRYYAGRSELAYHVEASADLVSWDDQGIIIGEPDANGFRTASMARSDGKRFLRLVVRQ